MIQHLNLDVNTKWLSKQEEVALWRTPKVCTERRVVLLKGTVIVIASRTQLCPPTDLREETTLKREEEEEKDVRKPERDVILGP